MDDNKKFKEYDMNMDRLTHFEKILVTVNSIFLAGLYFVFKNPDHSWIALIISSIILICISIVYIHLMVISISYVEDIIEIEKELGIDLIGKKWKRFEGSLKVTYIFIAFSPCIITIISIPLLSLIDPSIPKIILSLFIVACYTFFIYKYAFSPFSESSENLRASLIGNESGH